MSHLEPVDPVDPEQDDIEVDIDLDAIDEDLRRESVGDDTTVRIDGKVLHVIHAGKWSSTAMRAASQGNWELWAREVIADDEEFKHWVEADLMNYQVEAIFTQCGKSARMSTGKSQRRGGSRRSSRTR